MLLSLRGPLESWPFCLQLKQTVPLYIAGWLGLCLVTDDCQWMSVYDTKTFIFVFTPIYVFINCLSLVFLIQHEGC